jgi:DNA-directed RNA polymerase specialized sigma24 family protein/DNA-binding MarR family transcriptional regulator
MELLYNPDRMPEEEIKATFVAREQLVDELVALVKGQPDGAGVQHAVIIAPRGMGKTTVLLMVKFAIKDRGLADRWQAVKFPEESYGVYDLADFWIETLDLIASDTADIELRQLANDLKTKYPNNDELQEAAYAALKDWRRKHGLRLLLLVENFDQILEQINDDRDNARLRDVMMNDGTLMLLGGATTFFKEARAYDQPLYNFFKIYNLADLRFEQMQELLRRRAELDRVAGFETKLKQNINRLRTLEYFTGGNPRLVLMLYRVVSHSEVTEVRHALEKLLDEVTPYYKAKIENLPPQQRKILDHIARVSGETNEGLTPTEIAVVVRLSPNQVSSQLKRLSELGYVRTANLRGRNSFYTLSEPLYAIWHQMRFGRNAREKMQWLVSFLRVWYAKDEFELESRRLEDRFRQYIIINRSREARDVLEHHHYLVRAMERTPEQVDAINRVICDYLDIGKDEVVKKELLGEVSLEYLPESTLIRLYQVGCINEEQFSLAKVLKSSHIVEETSDLNVLMPALTGERQKDLDRKSGPYSWRPDIDQSFNLLLGKLDIDREEAGRKYEELHRKLVTYIRWKGASFPEELADETLNRVARKLPNGREIENLAEFCFGVARIVLLEELKKPVAEDISILSDIPVWQESFEEDDGLYHCFKLCLSAFSNEDQELLIKYYEGEGRARAENRKALAQTLGVTQHKLVKRLIRLRAKLRESIEGCLESRQRRGIPKENLEELRLQHEFNDLLSIAQSGDLNLVRQSITESNMENQFFPLLRAIDYLQTGDDALIEKLSPEVRVIVEEVVAKLKATSQAGS